MLNLAVLACILMALVLLWLFIAEPLGLNDRLRKLRRRFRKNRGHYHRPTASRRRSH